MGLGGGSRNPFEFFRRIDCGNVAFEFNSVYCSKFSTINIAVDLNVILHCIIGNTIVHEENIGDLVRRQLPYRAAQYLAKILSVVNLDKQKLNVYLVADNGSPPAKEYERIKREKSTATNKFKGLIMSNRDHMEVLSAEITGRLGNSIILNQSADSKYDCADNLTIEYCVDMIGEGEHNCIKYLALNNQTINNIEHIEQSLVLNLVLSTDSDLITYCLSNTFTKRSNTPVCFLNLRKVTNADTNEEAIFVYNFKNFANFLESSIGFSSNVCSSYLFIILSLHGNDYLPCVINTKVSFERLTNFAIDFMRESRNATEKDGFSVELFKHLLKVANNENMLKHSKRLSSTRNKKEQIQALEEWYTFIRKVIEYNCDASTLDYDNISSFNYCEPFAHMVYFNSCFNKKSWKSLLGN